MCVAIFYKCTIYLFTKTENILTSKRKRKQLGQNSSAIEWRRVEACVDIKARTYWYIRQVMMV